MQVAGSWWNGLTSLNQWFYIAAIFFSLFLLVQLVTAIFGLAAGDHGLDSAAGDSLDHDSPDDATQTVAVFKLFSIRSLVAFFTLFTWAGALYLNNGKPLTSALGLGLVWGMAGLIAVSFLMNMMGRMTESGNAQLATCLGAEGTVHLDIPAGGEGEIRVMVSGALTHLRARTVQSNAIAAGGRVRVMRVIGPGSVEVEEWGNQDREASNG